MSENRKTGLVKVDDLTKILGNLLKPIQSTVSGLQSTVSGIDAKLTGLETQQKKLTNIVSDLKTRNGEFDEERMRKIISKNFGKSFSKSYFVKSLIHVFKLLVDKRIEKKCTLLDRKLEIQMENAKKFFNNQGIKRILTDLLHERLVKTFKLEKEDLKDTPTCMEELKKAKKPQKKIIEKMLLLNLIKESKEKDVTELIKKKLESASISGMPKNLISSFYSGDNLFYNCLGKDSGKGFAKLLVLCTLLYPKFGIYRNEIEFDIRGNCSNLVDSKGELFNNSYSGSITIGEAKTSIDVNSYRKIIHQLKERSTLLFAFFRILHCDSEKTKFKTRKDLLAFFTEEKSVHLVLYIFYSFKSKRFKINEFSDDKDWELDGSFINYKTGFK